VSGKRTTCRLAQNSIEALAYLKQLVEQGDLRVVVDRCYSMQQIVEAHHYVEQGHKAGNVVILIGEGNANST
jgi:NADPH:quinone reductase-like Zn-dependent oxidoreductase